MLSPAEEIRFWTGIMRDHSEFILTSLSYNEQEAMKIAASYKDTFIRLHEQSKSLEGIKDVNALQTLINECMSVLASFINFKRLLLGRLLECKLDTSLPPTFYNHMINEAMEFCKTLVRIQSNIPVNPLIGNLNLHRIWLPDAAGHAATIACELDPIEKLLINEAREFEKCFNHLTLKAEELAKMICRTCAGERALLFLNEEVIKKIEEFICYLDKIRRLRMSCMALGVLKTLVPDHMIREETYYLHKIMM